MRIPLHIIAVICLSLFLGFQIKKPSMILASASCSVKPSVWSFKSCSPAIFPMAASWISCASPLRALSEGEASTIPLPAMIASQAECRYRERCRKLRTRRTGGNRRARPEARETRSTPEPAPFSSTRKCVVASCPSLRSGIRSRDEQLWRPLQGRPRSCGPSGLRRRSAPYPFREQRLFPVPPR